MEKLTFNELAVEGERLCQCGDYVNGIKHFEHAINIYNKEINQNNEDLRNLQTLCIIYNQLGNGYFCLQKYRQALEYHKKDLELSE
jgi:tetratricopeptide (TPR) repeat protein